MPSLVVSGAAQLRLIWSYDGQTAINVIGLFRTGASPVDQSMANRWGTAIKTLISGGGMGTVLATSVQLAAVGVRDLAGAGNPEFIDSGGPVSGVAAGDMLPRQTALVMTIRTAHATRSGRGRIYFGGFSELENTAAGVASPAVTTALNEFIGGVSNTVNADGFSIGVIQRPANAKTTTSVETLPDGTTVTHTHHQLARTGIVRPQTALEVRDQAWDTQRRRNNGRGSTVLAMLGFSSRLQVNPTTGRLDSVPVRR